MDRGFLTGCHDFFVGGVQLGNPKIISDAVVEQMGFWVTKLSKSRRFPVLISFTARPDKGNFPFLDLPKRMNSFSNVDFPLPLRPSQCPQFDSEEFPQKHHPE